MNKGWGSNGRGVGDGTGAKGKREGTNNLEGYFSLSSLLMSRTPVTRRMVGRRTMPNPRAVTPDVAGETREMKTRDV
jgi:hypothetical protein